MYSTKELHGRSPPFLVGHHSHVHGREIVGHRRMRHPPCHNTPACQPQLRRTVLNVLSCGAIPYEEQGHSRQLCDGFEQQPEPVPVAQNASPAHRRRGMQSVLTPDTRWVRMSPVKLEGIRPVWQDDRLPGDQLLDLARQWG